MERENKRILGINPGTRYLGLAVFDGSNLLDWRVKTFNGKWTKEKEIRILNTIGEHITLYDINTIAIKKLHPARASKNLLILVARVKTLVKRKRIVVRSYSIKELEGLFLVGEKPNKRSLAEKIAIEYPIIARELIREKLKRNPYYMRGIEATALAMASFFGRVFNLLTKNI